MEIKQISISEIEHRLSQSVFTSASYLNMYRDDLYVYGIFNGAKQIGFFYLARYKRLKFINQWSNPIFTPNCGLFFENNSSNPARKLSEDKAVFQAISTFFDSKKKEIISVAFPLEVKDMQPFIWDNFKVITHYTYHIKLNKEAELLLNDMSSERRKNIKKAIKDNLYTKEEIHSKEALKLILNTYARQGNKVDKSFITKLVMEFSNEKNSVCHVTYNSDDKPIACNLCLYDVEKMYYVLGGYDEKNSHEGAGAFAMWKSILKAKEMNLNTFDFVGSMQENIERFFRGFGGDILPYYTINKAPFMIEGLLKIKNRNHF